MPRPYVPARGDLIWLNFNPQAGREQAGHRPALVLTPREYSRMTGLALCCPVTRQVKGYAFEVVLPVGLAVEGAVLADHVTSVDLRARGAERIASAPEGVVKQVTARIAALLRTRG